MHANPRRSVGHLRDVPSSRHWWVARVSVGRCDCDAIARCAPTPRRRCAGCFFVARQLVFPSFVHTCGRCKYCFLVRHCTRRTETKEHSRQFSPKQSLDRTPLEARMQASLASLMNIRKSCLGFTSLHISRERMCLTHLHVFRKILNRSYLSPRFAVFLSYP